MRSYSDSSLKAWGRCPWQAWRDRVAPVPAGAAAESGTLLHEFVEWVHRHDIEDTPAVNSALRLIAAKAHTESVREDVIQVGQAWRDRRVERADWARDGRVEWSFAFDVNWKRVPYVDERARFRGRIDYLTSNRQDTIILLDHKTGHIIPKDLPWPQLETYAWAALQHFPKFRRVRMAIDFLRFDFQPSRLVERDELDWVPKELERQMRDADLIVDRYFAGRAPIPARINEYCGNCAHKVTCPALHELLSLASINRGLLPLSAYEDAQVCANTVKLLEGATKEARKHLKNWVASEGPVPVGDGKQYSLSSNHQLRLMNEPNHGE